MSASPLVLSSPVSASELESKDEFSDRFVELYRSTALSAGYGILADDELRAAVQLVPGQSGQQMRLAQDLQRMSRQTQECKVIIAEQRDVVARLHDPAAATLGSTLLDNLENDNAVMDNNVNSARLAIGMLRGFAGVIAPFCSLPTADQLSLVGDQQPLLTDEPASQPTALPSSASPAAPDGAVPTTQPRLPLSPEQNSSLRSIASCLSGIARYAQQTHLLLVGNALKASSAVRKAVELDGHKFEQDAKLQQALADMEEKTVEAQEEINSGNKWPNLDAQVTSCQHVVDAANAVEFNSHTAMAARMQAARFTNLQAATAVVGALSAVAAIAATTLLFVFSPSMGLRVLCPLLALLTVSVSTLLL